MKIRALAHIISVLTLIVKSLFCILKLFCFGKVLPNFFTDLNLNYYITDDLNYITS